MSNGAMMEEMDIDDYSEIFALWKCDANIRLSAADSYDKIKLFLDRNPHTNYVLRHDAKIIGTILCGNDGRRGYFHHLYVDKSFRGKGYGKTLLDKGIEELKNIGILKGHIFVFPTNHNGQAFWMKMGFCKRRRSPICFETIFST